MARIAASAWWHTTGWTVGASLRLGSRVARAAASGEAPGALFEETWADMRAYAREVLGIVEGESGLRFSDPGRPDVPLARDEDSSTAMLRERGRELLRRSADVRYEEDTHPAYARILEVLAPDEARILRLLATGGPQPAVDVRSGLPLASELIAPGLSMIGAEAGCRHLDSVQAYLNNLYRLGLIWFSREAVKDRLRYQVLEAQPEVVEAMETGGRTARTVRRSIHLTPFGVDFCKMCLPLDTTEIDALPSSPTP